MKLTDLDFSYPEHLVATERLPQSRVMLVEKGEPREVGTAQLLREHEFFRSGDCLIINDTRVLSRRVFTESGAGAGLEILFLHSDPSRKIWQVLCPASKWKDSETQKLPGGVSLTLKSRGRPQTVESSLPLDETYFEMNGEMPLPPYIQKARGERHTRKEDSSQYQTAWAEKNGSLAAPTASLHFKKGELESLSAQGVKIAKLTLHVGLGTFLPVTSENLDEHVMHGEFTEISDETWKMIQETKASGGRVWALGTTVARALESAALGKIEKDYDRGGFFGVTDLFIRPGFEYKVVDVLMTNFHQPKSTLLALVAAFSDLKTVKQCYDWAIKKEFRLFSYGDLSVWIK